MGADARHRYGYQHRSPDRRGDPENIATAINQPRRVALFGFEAGFLMPEIVAGDHENPTCGLPGPASEWNSPAVTKPNPMNRVGRGVNKIGKDLNIKSPCERNITKHQTSRLYAAPESISLKTLPVGLGL